MTNEDNAEVYLTILCDIRVRQGHILTGNQIIQEFKRIQNSVKKVKGITNAYLVLREGVADITAFANWNESEIKTRIEEVKRISGIKSVESKVLVPA